MLENLHVAAKLRSPVTHVRSNLRSSKVLRAREVRSLVDEVMALMALTKVAHMVRLVFSLISENVVIKQRFLLGLWLHKLWISDVDAYFN